MKTINDLKKFVTRLSDLENELKKVEITAWKSGINIVFASTVVGNIKNDLRKEILELLEQFGFNEFYEQRKFEEEIKDSNFLHAQLIKEGELQDENSKNN